MKDGMIPKYFIFAALSIIIGLLSMNLKFAFTRGFAYLLESAFEYLPLWMTKATTAKRATAIIGTRLIIIRKNPLTGCST